MDGKSLAALPQAVRAHSKQPGHLARLLAAFL
jgi:hypothetical protein